MREAACAMISLAQVAGARAIAVGSDASEEPGPYLLAGADAVLIGEGLESLQALVARLDHDVATPASELSDVAPGIAVMIDSEVRVRTDGRRLAVSTPAPPAWDLIDLRRYREIWQHAHGYFSLNLAASRGCSFRCHWCSKPIWGNQYLQRDAREIAAEMAELKRRYGAEHVWFADDIFGFRVDWVTRFAAELRECDGGLPFTIQTRADLMSPAMAHALAQAGCREVWIGAESGSQRILDAMNKGTTIEQIIAARTRLRAEHIRVGFFIQLGYLGEELEDILATRDLIERCDPDDIGVSVSYPLPGTVFYEQVRQQFGDKTHWNESDDLAMMFHGRYGTPFYREVRDLLHEQVAARQPMAASIRPEERQRKLRQRWRQLIASEHSLRRADEPDQVLQTPIHFAKPSG